jgi:hypothetical protein
MLLASAFQTERVVFEDAVSLALAEPNLCLPVFVHPLKRYAFVKVRNMKNPEAFGHVTPPPTICEACISTYRLFATRGFQPVSRKT